MTRAGRGTRARALAVVAAAAAAGAGAAGCDTPPLTLELRLSQGPTQPCPGDQCSQIADLCDAVLNVRVLRPSEPLSPFISYCDEITPNRKRDLCAVSAVELPRREDLPKETLEVQVLIWPRAAVKRDPMTGEYDCREIDGEATSIDFDLNGFPQETTPAPALGGHAYFHPGDERTVVTLGCSNLTSLTEPVCQSDASIAVTATVNDFDDPTRSVDVSTGESLLVSVGEPKYTGSRFTLSGSQKRTLDPAPSDGAPTWSKVLPDFELGGVVCIDVKEDASATAATLRCRQTAAGGRELDFTGVYLRTARLKQLLAAAELAATAPAEGITIGIVLDESGRPAAGIPIGMNPPPPESEQGDALVFLNGAGTGKATGATATTSSGLFVARRAPFGTEFTAFGPMSRTASAIGGLVAEKVTLVVLQLAAVSS